ncbi:citrate lyase subunit beta-like protein [Coleophoma cylindrospora]|uniref:Citrate lyase subunit beta-like protein n=1 Tax=Coleophoma cylindrospora TaxID=1849047 RepID=A0A3D8QKX3_9HELO|nr:citrate lyase subunit beta-like protein [Coleophoma cylindrospora]
MAPGKQILRRAMLYVPTSSRKMMEKALNLDVDMVAFDLEDSVTLSLKPEARIAAREILHLPRPSGVGELAVRINAPETGLALEDLTEVLKAPNLDTIVVPKVNSAADLHFVTDVVRHLRPSKELSPENKPPVRILALIESAKALSSLNEICSASPYLTGLAFAAEDFAADLSITRTPSLSEFLYARSAIVTACRAHDLPSSIDLVSTKIKGEDAMNELQEECIGGRGLGFNGKQCIHPSQVRIAQNAFGPNSREVEWAVRVVIANEKAEMAGRGAWTLDGKMIDVPVVMAARAMINKAILCKIDISAVQDAWQTQQPE